MIRPKINQKKIEEVIKKGGTSPQSLSKEEETIKLVQLRMPVVLRDEIDTLLKKKKEKNLGFKKPRHDFLIDAIIKCVQEEKVRIYS